MPQKQRATMSNQQTTAEVAIEDHIAAVRREGDALREAAKAADEAIASGVMDDIWRTVTELCDREYDMTGDCKAFWSLAEQYGIPGSYPPEDSPEEQCVRGSAGLCQTCGDPRCFGCTEEDQQPF